MGRKNGVSGVFDCIFAELEIVVLQNLCSGTVFQFNANSTNRPAFMRPYPNLFETNLPAPFFRQSFDSNKLGCDDCTSKCCTSRHDNSGFASSPSAMIPAANGAEADVPEKFSVQI